MRRKAIRCYDMGKSGLGSAFRSLVFLIIGKPCMRFGYGMFSTLMVHRMELCGMSLEIWVRGSIVHIWWMGFDIGWLMR